MWKKMQMFVSFEAISENNAHLVVIGMTASNFQEDFSLFLVNYTDCAHAKIHT